MNGTDGRDGAGLGNIEALPGNDEDETEEEAHQSEVRDEPDGE